MRLAHLILATLALTCVSILHAAEPATVAELAAAIQAKSPDEQYSAVDRLAATGPRAASALPQLAEALKSKDPELRWRAARAIGRIGSNKSAESLRPLIGDENALVRAHAIYALGQLRVADEATLAAIIDKLNDPDAQVRRTVVSALRNIADRKQVLPLIVKTLEDEDPAVVMPALHMLAEAGPDVVPALVEALDNKEARYWACLVLEELGPAAKPAVPALQKVLGDERPEVRLQAVIALAEIGPDAKAAMPDIVKLMADREPGVVYAATFALGKIGDPSTIDHLSRAAESDDRFLKLLGMWALARLDKDNPQRTQAAAVDLVRALAETDQGFREMAARALADLGAPNELIASEVEKLTAAADHETVDRVTSALASLGPRVVPFAVKGLNVKERRTNSLRLLSRVGPEAAPAVPELIALLNDEDPQTRIETLFTLGAIGPGAKSAVGAAAASLGDENQEVQLAAGYCLGRMGADAKEAAPSLRKLLESKDVLLQLVALRALLRIEPPSEELAQQAVPILVAGLGHERDFVRVEAAMGLGDLGPQAARAIPELEETLQDEHPDVRLAAEDAIRRIQKPTTGKQAKR